MPRNPLLIAVALLALGLAGCQTVSQKETKAFDEYSLVRVPTPRVEYSGATSARGATRPTFNSKAIPGAQLNIGFGTAANDATGDTLRTFAGKTQTNFTELYANLTIVSNLAAAGGGGGGSATNKLSISSNLLDVASASAARVNLGAAAQSDLTTVSNTANGKLAIASNLSDLASVSTARSNIGLKDVASIAELRALNTSTIKDYVLVSGYYARGDCTPRLFWWNASGSTGTNFGTIFKDGADSATGRWQLQYDTSGPVFDVKWFGAKGDGSTDDQARFDSARSTLGALGGGTLYCPKGTYMFGSLWNVTSSNIRIVGAGPMQTVFKPLVALNLFVATGSTRTNVTWEGIWFNCDNKAVNGLYNDTYVKDITVRNCRFSDELLDDTFNSSGGGRGTLLSFAIGTIRARVTHCSFRNTAHTDYLGTPTHAGERITCGIFAGAGLSGWASSADNWEEIIIEDCDFTNIDPTREGYAICLENHETSNSKFSILDCRADTYGERFIKVLNGRGNISHVFGRSYDTNVSSHILLAGREITLSNFRIEGDGEHGVVVSSPYTNLATANVKISHGSINFTNAARSKNNKGVTLTTYPGTAAYGLTVEDVNVAEANFGIRLEGNVRSSRVNGTIVTNVGTGILVTSSTNAFPSDVYLGNLISYGTVTNGFLISGGTNINRGTHAGTATTPANRAAGVTGNYIPEALGDYAPSANQILAYTSGATNLQGKTLVAGSNISISHSGTNITIGLSGSPAPSGTMVSDLATFIAGTVPISKDTTGTNFTGTAALTVTSTNLSVKGTLFVDNVVATNGLQLGSGSTNLSITGNVLANGGVFTNTLTLGGNTVATSANHLGFFGATTSAQLFGVISDETGSSSGTPLAVFNQSPVIVTPTIASFANANHNHQNSAGGGALDAAAISTGIFASGRIPTNAVQEKVWVAIGSTNIGVFDRLTLWPGSNITLANTNGAGNTNIDITITSSGGGGGGGTAGSMISSGSFATGAAPVASDTTGTNFQSSKVILTAPATTATLTIANNKTVTVNKSITLDGTDSTTITLPAATASVLSTASAEINALTSKGTPTTSDLLVIEDAAASNAKKKITIGSLPAATPPAITALGDAATITGLDLSVSDDFIVTLGGNRTLPTPSNIPSPGGRKFRVWFVQDATGSRTLTLATNYTFGSDITAITLTTTATKGDCATFEAFSTNSVVRCLGFVRGYQF